MLAGLKLKLKYNYTHFVCTYTNISIDAQNSMDLAIFMFPSDPHVSQRDDNNNNIIETTPDLSSLNFVKHS